MVTPVWTHGPPSRRILHSHELADLAFFEFIALDARACAPYA